jgi:membrane protein DedA with SNARE-associated domain
VPLAAGIFEMPYWRFQIANFTSAFVWAAVVLAPGTFGVKMMMH